MDFPYTLSPDRPPQIGVIVLSADETLEPDFRRLLPAPIEVLVSRVPSGDQALPETLRSMDGALAEAASRFPHGARFASVGYGCTSATAQIGAVRVRAQIGEGLGTAKPTVSDPLTACIAACKALGVSRLALLSPYVPDVSARLVETLAAAGLTVPHVGSFHVAEEARVVRIDAASILAAATAGGQSSDCDGVFLSCTNLRTLDIIAPLERALGKPVLSSNQVLAWHLAKIAGVSDHACIPGALCQV